MKTRQEKFAEWLTGIGVTLMVINTICVGFAHYWVFLGIDCAFLLALIIYALAVYFSEHDNH